jgi:hypothetical protein
MKLKIIIIILYIILNKINKNIKKGPNLIYIKISI